MSYSIIKINRGDSIELTIPVLEPYSDSKHLLMANEAVYFALMYPHQKFEDALVLKGYTLEDQNVRTGEVLVKISHNDTKDLEPGIYYYTAKLKRGGNLLVVNGNDEPEEVRTLIERTKFIINP
jgi:hypothetical protein